MDLVRAIISYEEDKLAFDDTLELFSQLIKSGRAWTLQGHYGRVASQLIEDGLISSDGELNQEAIEQAMESLEEV